MPEPTAAVPLAERIVRTRPRAAYLSIPVPVDDDPAMANVLFIRAVRDEARRRGITLDEPSFRLAPVPADKPAGRHRQSASARQRHAGPPPDPSHAQNPGALLRAMRQLRRWAGNPTLRDLADRSAELRRPVSRATLGRALGGAGWPSLKTLTSFVLACGVNEREWRVWANAWHRVTDGATQRETAATMLLGSTAVRIPTDSLWWQDILVESASAQELEARRVESAEWAQLYPAPALAA